MRTEKELAQATLADLATQVLESQMQWALIRGERMEVEEILMELIDQEKQVEKLLDGLHAKANWELTHNAKVLGVNIVPAPNEDDAPPY